MRAHAKHASKPEPPPDLATVAIRVRGLEHAGMWLHAWVSACVCVCVCQREEGGEGMPSTTSLPTESQSLVLCLFPCCPGLLFPLLP